VRKHKDRVVFHFTVRQTLIDGRQLGTEDGSLGRQQLVPQGVLAIHRRALQELGIRWIPASSPQAKRAYSSHRSEVPFRLYGMAPPSRSSGMHHSTHHSNTHHGAVSSRTVQVLNRFVTNLSHAISECSELLVSASLQPSSAVIREVEVSSDTLRCTLDSGNGTRPQASKGKKESCCTKRGSRGKPPLRPVPPSGDRT